MRECRWTNSSSASDGYTSIASPVVQAKSAPVEVPADAQAHDARARNSPLKPEVPRTYLYLHICESTLTVLHSLFFSLSLSLSLISVRWVRSRVCWVKTRLFLCVPLPPLFSPKPTNETALLLFSLNLSLFLSLSLVRMIGA